MDGSSLEIGRFSHSFKAFSIHTHTKKTKNPVFFPLKRKKSSLLNKNPK